MNIIKTNILVAVLSLSIYSTYAENKEINSEAKEITVYLQGAQVIREAKTYINAGKTDILISDLSPFIDANTIQVKGKGDFTILAINHQINYLKQNQKSKRVIVLEDSLELLNKKINKLNAMQAVYNEEQTLLLANKAIGGTQNGVSITELQKAADLFRARLTEIKEKILTLQEDIDKTSLEKNKISSQLNAERGIKSGPVGEIVVTVSTDKPQNIALSYQYLVSHAGWVPYYDLRSKDTKSPVEIDYRANVFQSSGEEWNNINLTLSTADPSKGGNKPTLYPWYINIYEPYTYRTTSKGSYAKKAEVMDSKESLAIESEEMPAYEMDASTVADYTQVVTKQTNLEYQIKLPASIKPDGKLISVNIADRKSVV